MTPDLHKLASGKRAVWKFEIRGESIQIPFDAFPVHVGLDPQSKRPSIWIELNPDAPMVERKFSIHGTGHSFQHEAGFPLHVGSMIDGPFVWHVYEERALLNEEQRS